MPNVLIRNLDPQVHAVLTARAEARGQSLQQYLTEELTELAAKPTLAEFFAELEAGPPGPRLDPDDIVRAIHEGREGR
jgi:plasmid stability protein